MADRKTVATDAPVAAFLDTVADAPRRADCDTLIAMMSRASGQPARLWGTAIVGFGVHRYPLAGGKTGEICAVGFSPRKGDISIYGVSGEDTDAASLARLGRHKLGKGCLYVRQLADIDLGVLERLVRDAAARRDG